MYAPAAVAANELITCTQQAGTFLLARQGPAGCWCDFHLGVGLGSQWVTGYIGHSIARYRAAGSALLKARDWLVSTEYRQGGWGFNDKVLPDGDSTANVLLFLAGRAKSRQALRRISSVLMRYHSPESGSFSTYYPLPPEKRSDITQMLTPGSGWCAPHPSVTALAAEALCATQLPEYRPVVQRAIAYLLEQQSSEGFWEAYWWNGRMYSSYRAIRLMILQQQKEAALAAVDWLISAINADGGWSNGYPGPSSAFHTALAVASLAACRNRMHVREPLQAGLEWLYNAQQDDGSWISHYPLMRIANPAEQRPWVEDALPALGLVQDREHLFTTATALHALQMAHTLNN